MIPPLKNLNYAQIYKCARNKFLTRSRLCCTTAATSKTKLAQNAGLILHNLLILVCFIILYYSYVKENYLNTQIKFN